VTCIYVKNCEHSILARFHQKLVCVEISFYLLDTIVIIITCCSSLILFHNIMSCSLCRLGSCHTYIGGDDSRPSPCDPFFTINVDTFYLPSGRFTVQTLNNFIANTDLVFTTLSSSCR